MSYATIDLTVGNYVMYNERITEMVIEQAVQMIKVKLEMAGIEEDDYIITVGGGQ